MCKFTGQEQVNGNNNSSAIRLLGPEEVKTSIPKDVFSKLDSLGCIVVELENRYDVLRSRISPILNHCPQPTCGEENKALARGANCQISEQIFNTIERIETVINCINKDISDCEV